jgi:lyso-ornithine lipid O-acyltransferase
MSGVRARDDLFGKADGLLRTARAAVRLAALLTSTAAVYAAWNAVRLFARGRRERAWRRLCFRAWGHLAARAMGMRLRVRGAAPRGPFLLVANHLGYADVVALAAATGAAFVAKSEVARWPLVGALSRGAGTIFVERGRRRGLPGSLARIERELKAGAGVVLFAEGTSTAGARVGAFKSSLLEAAARADAPVHYAALSYRTPAGEPEASRAVCWWGEMTFPAHVFGLLRLSRFEAELVFGEEPVRAADRKALAGELWSAVSARFNPVV